MCELPHTDTLWLRAAWIAGGFTVQRRVNHSLNLRAANADRPPSAVGQRRRWR